MIVSAFRIMNFMAFSDSGWLDIKPITLLFGQNSSGKSSILKALMFLKQSAKKGALTYYSEDGIDLGSYENIANGSTKSAYKKSEKRLTFGFRFDLEGDQFADIKLQNNSFTMVIDVGWNNKKNIAEVIAFEIDAVPKDILQDELFFRVEIEDYVNEEVNSNLIFSTNLIGEVPSLSKTDVWQYVTLKTEHGFIPALDIKNTLVLPERYRDWDFIKGLLIRSKNILLDFLESLTYIKPIRPNPERLYVIKDIEQEEYRREGFSAYLKFLSHKYSETQQESALNKWIQYLGFGQNIQPARYENVPGTSIISEVLLTDLFGNQVNIADVGFGVSQVVPVLIECIFSDSGTTILVQQPELHLHPAAQSDLGDLFIDLAMTMNKRFIIETHSEHLILRIIRRIRETLINKLPQGGISLSADALSVIVVTRNPKKNISDATSVKFNAEGQMITPWPGGFFEDGFKERFSID